jgi:hypothetical protein
MLRATDRGDFIPAWPGPKYVEVERDEPLIARLQDVANDLYRELQAIRG